MLASAARRLRFPVKNQQIAATATPQQAKSHLASAIPKAAAKIGKKAHARAAAPKAALLRECRPACFDQ